MTSSQKIGSWAFVLIGIGLCIMSIYSLSRTLRLVRVGTRTIGTVIRIDVNKNATDRHTESATVYEFKTTHGETFSATATYTSTQALHTIGDPIPVIYDPADPNHSSIDDSRDLWGVATIFPIFGLVMILCGAVPLRLNKKAP